MLVGGSGVVLDLDGGLQRRDAARRVHLARVGEGDDGEPRLLLGRRRGIRLLRVLLRGRVLHKGSDDAVPCSGPSIHTTTRTDSHVRALTRRF